jgi:hypothetical protein
MVEVGRLRFGVFIWRGSRRVRDVEDRVCCGVSRTAGYA